MEQKFDGENIDKFDKSHIKILIQIFPPKTFCMPKDDPVYQSPICHNLTL